MAGQNDNCHQYTLATNERAQEKHRNGFLLISFDWNGESGVIKTAMAKSDYEAETRMLLRGIKQGHTLVNATRILNENLNTQILLAMEARASLEKSRVETRHMLRSNHENSSR